MTFSAKCYYFDVKYMFQIQLSIPLVPIHLGAPLAKQNALCLILLFPKQFQCSLHTIQQRLKFDLKDFSERLLACILGKRMEIKLIVSSILTSCTGTGAYNLMGKHHK